MPPRECLIEATPRVEAALARAGLSSALLPAVAGARGATFPAVAADRLAAACARLRDRGEDAYLHVITRGARVAVPHAVGTGGAGGAGEADADADADADAAAAGAGSMSAARRRELREQDEQRRYDAMVADVAWGAAKQGAGASSAQEGSVGSYRAALAFGTNLLVVLGTFAAFGGMAAPHVLPRAFPRQAAQAAGAALGIAVGLLVETVLFVIRDQRETRERDQRGRREHAGKEKAE